LIHKASAASPAAAARRGAGSTGVGQVPRETGAGSGSTGCAFPDGVFAGLALPGGGFSGTAGDYRRTGFRARSDDPGPA